MSNRETANLALRREIIDDINSVAVSVGLTAPEVRRSSRSSAVVILETDYVALIHFNSRIAPVLVEQHNQSSLRRDGSSLSDVGAWNRQTGPVEIDYLCWSSQSQRRIAFERLGARGNRVQTLRECQGPLMSFADRLRR